MFLDYFLFRKFYIKKVYLIFFNCFLNDKCIGKLVYGNGFKMYFELFMIEYFSFI